jgi:hypothetical protein
MATRTATRSRTTSDGEPVPEPNRVCTWPTCPSSR